MRALRTILAILLVLEVVNAMLWSSRIVSAAATYDAVVLLMVLIRVAVSALQAISAWMLVERAPPALTFATYGFLLSAVLIVFELGFRLSPSNVTPGLRTPVIVAYILYAGAAVGVIRYLQRTESS